MTKKMFENTVFFCEFCEDFKNNVFTKHHGATASMF